MEQVIEQVKSSTDVLISLKTLGDYLREETNRSSELIQENLLSLLAQFNRLFQSENDDILLEILRVIINLLASNDYNRDFYTQDDVQEVGQFWEIIKNNLVDGSDPKSERIAILLSQFIYDTDHTEQYFQYFHSINIQENIYKLLSTDNLANLSILFEFALELFRNNQRLNEMDYDFIKKSPDILVYLTSHWDTLEDDLDEEIWEHLVDICEFNKPDNSTFVRIIDLIPIIPESLSNKVKLKRKLFAMASELSDETSFDTAVGYLKNTTDSYVFAACCIVIGNFVHDVNSFQDINGRIIESFGNSTKIVDVFMENFKITDVVQVQAIHMMTNLLDETRASRIFTYKEQSRALTKVVIDNEKYYQEVAALYLNFLKKLTRLGILEVVNSKVGLDDLWDVVFEFGEDNQKVLEIKYLILLEVVLNGFGNKSASLNRELIKAAVRPLSTNAAMGINHILEKLKALGIFHQELSKASIQELVDSAYSGNLDQFIQEYLVPYCELWEQLVPQLETTDENKETPQYKILLNNSRYVAGITISVFQDYDLVEEEKEVSRLVELCKKVITIPGYM